MYLCMCWYCFNALSKIKTKHTILNTNEHFENLKYYFKMNNKPDSCTLFIAICTTDASTTNAIE